jgi:antitoxin component YwqK of YwqJK toxin-antitoxin module
MKKLTFFLSIFILLILTACSTPEFSNPFGKKVKKEYFTGGGLRSEFILSGDSGNTGLLKKYGYDGKLTSSAQMNNGVKHGVETFYDSRGRELRRTIYKRNRRHGIAKVFYPNGDSLAEITFVNGIKHGRATKFNKDGSINKQVMFKNGRPIN